MLTIWHQHLNELIDLLRLLALPAPLTEYDVAANATAPSQALHSGQWQLAALPDQANLLCVLHMQGWEGGGASGAVGGAGPIELTAVVWLCCQAHFVQQAQATEAATFS